MAKEPSMKRLSIDVSQEEYDLVQDLIPWGLRNRIIRILINSMVSAVQKHGDVVFGALLTGRITALDLLRKGGDNSGLIGPQGGAGGTE